ncbi:hypothetical protein THAOC_02984 [Thalassiosira oceanica]|uniref:Pre-mRNA-splicing factor Syf1/CRNKL1-like C-terminal HAT-repeats domain-containing protein n=1 Tax=Thalassiosira oceanica TaxID=159749 RepID=K0T996_THAOC|nr:hypothetical protein THAOC_02984 [Thalassiosira oceanica]|eukprot:EJK75293.1 hypothetical protein THAOC_02984 [Thalassiosira oceanica]
MTGRKNSSPKAGGRPRFKKKKSYRGKKKFTRKLPLGPSEKAAQYARRERRKAYEALRTKSLEKTNEPPSIWNFESLFAEPIFDETSIREDLYGNAERADEVRRRHDSQDLERSRVRESAEAAKGSGSPAELAGEPITGPFSGGRVKASSREEDLKLTRQAIVDNFKSEESIRESTLDNCDEIEESTETNAVNTQAGEGQESKTADEKDEDREQPRLVNPALTRMVEDRIYGMARSLAGATYSTSLLDSGRAVQFREGRRLGKALTINIDRLCHFAKKDFSKGRFEEAQEGYMEARNLDPSDGRPYLGLSRVAQRRGDLLLARKLLKEGISRCDGGYVVVKRPKEKGGKKNYQKIDEIDEAFDDSNIIGTISDSGPNPFLLQALGTLEQKLGNLGTAEELYLQAIRSRPSHAAAWVSLAQLRTKVLRQGASAGRACYQSAERELRRINAPPSSFVYTAWASMEYKKSSASASSKSVKRARDLYLKALEVDPKCSVAYLQLGVMESDIGNFDSARECFEKVLKFDQRNSRVLQAYALMESRREDADDRKVLDLFERALKANPKDGGVYQAYALFVVELGDIESARDLLRRGTEVSKRHAPVWQAWGVLETRYGTAKSARDVFQRGIWACAQPGGSQSGGRRCARLWQAWGVLESREGDPAAGRRCFSRALDADPRNVAAITAWASMETDLGNLADARSIFERSLRLFRPSADKTAVWRAYEVMEERAGNTMEAQMVFNRSMRESMSDEGDSENIPESGADGLVLPAGPESNPTKPNQEFEVSRWERGSDDMDAEVWMNNGSIEGRVPERMMKRLWKDNSSRR